MKKIIALILTVILSFGAVACSAPFSEPASGIVGVWKYSANDDYVLDLVTDVINDPNVYVAYFYEFYEDGTGKTYVSTDTDVLEFTYVFNGDSITITGKDGTFETPCKLNGNILSIYDEVTGEYLDMKRQ